MTHYKHIFIPLTDIYQLGGPKTFEELKRDTSLNSEGRNLVIFPSQFSEVLDPDERKKGEHASEGAIEVLEYMKDFKNKRLTDDEASALLSSGFKQKNKLNGIAVYRLSEGLDLAYIDSTQISDESFSISHLEKIVRERWNHSESNQNITVITANAKNHINLSAKGLLVEDPKFLLVNEDIINNGIINGNEKLYAELQMNKLNGIALQDAVEILEQDLFMNQLIRLMGEKCHDYAIVAGDIIRNKTGSRIVGVDNMQVKLLPQDDKNKKIRIGHQYRHSILGIEPFDMEQFLALQYGLLNPDISCFFLCGGRGSGKTILSYAAGVALVLNVLNKETRKIRGMDEKKYPDGFFRQLLLLKPNETLGGSRRDVGFLPGTLYEKIQPHLSPYEDAHKETSLAFINFDEMFLHPRYENKYGPIRTSTLSSTAIDGIYTFPDNREVIQLEYSGFMRGRSFRNTLMIVDEAQNFTPYELKTILERLGPGCKAVILGDPAQFDNPLCSKSINGLTSAIKHYLEKPYCSLILLPGNYRSQISEDSDGWRVYSQ